MVRRPNDRRSSSRRRLACENLEARQLMASDFHFGHNFRMPEDTDGNGIVSPLDALRVINALNVGTKSSTESLDVTADGLISPRDALLVINYMNLNAPSAAGIVAPSNIDASSRISRIQAAIEANKLPASLSVEQAKEMVATLEAGASPELNECAADGLLADAMSELGSGTKLTDTLDKRLELLNERLVSLGVSQETADTLVTNIKTAIDEGATKLRQVINDEMEALGIDIKALIATARAEKQVEVIKVRLADLEVEQPVIDQVVKAMEDAIKAGTPLTKDQLIAKLEELGIDEEKVFAHKPIEPIDFLNKPVDATEVSERLKARGVEQSVIDTLVGEIKAAEEAGDPMTRRELVARLVELKIIGKPDTAPIRRLLEQIRHRRR